MQHSLTFYRKVSKCNIFLPSTGKCLSTEFKCVESPQCVLAEQTDDRRCNTITDCQDGSDEKPAAGCSK